MTNEALLKVLRDMKKKAEGAEKEALSASIMLVREKMKEKNKQNKQNKQEDYSSWNPGRPLTIDEAHYFYK